MFDIHQIDLNTTCILSSSEQHKMLFCESVDK